MSEELYNRQILEAAREQPAAETLAEADVRVDKDNPLCGDRVRLELRLVDERIAQLAHKTRGCLLTRAASATVARYAPGCGLREVRLLRRAVERILAGEEPDPRWPELAMFRPVAGVRSRHDCVRLPFVALAEALEGATPRTQNCGSPSAED